MDTILNFNDIIKKSVSQLGQFGSINFLDIVTVLTVTFLVSLLIYMLYRKTYPGVSYNNSYGISLVLMSLITSVIILTISSNVVLSLGMVGALSIVRFRTPVKEPLDIIFIFWSISNGICTGARFYLLSISGSIFISIVLLIMHRLSYTSSLYLFIVHYKKEAEISLNKILEGYKHQIKSKTVAQDNVELTLEIKCKTDTQDLINGVSALEGVTNTVLIKASPNTEV